MIYDYFRVTGTHETILDITDLMGIMLRQDDLQGSDTKWDEILLSVKDMHQDNVPESLYKFRISDFDQLMMVLTMYEQEVEQTSILPDYQRSKNMVKRFLDQKMVNRNLEARHENGEWFAKCGPKGKSVSGERKKAKLEETRGRGEGDYDQRKAKGRCSEGDSCSFRHEKNPHGQCKNEREATRSPHPVAKKATDNGGKSSSKGRPPRGSSPSGKKIPGDFLRGNCTKPQCDSWHPLECSKVSPW